MQKAAHNGLDDGICVILPDVFSKCEDIDAATDDRDVGHIDKQNIEREGFI